jgi:hypothetical protein
MNRLQSLPKFGLAAYGAAAIILGVFGFVWQDFAVNWQRVPYDLHQLLAARRDHARLRSAPVVDVADPVHAADGAMRRAALGRQKLALHVRRVYSAIGTPGYPRCCEQ